MRVKQKELCSPTADRLFSKAGWTSLAPRPILHSDSVMQTGFAAWWRKYICTSWDSDYSSELISENRQIEAHHCFSWSISSPGQESIPPSVPWGEEAVDDVLSIFASSSLFDRGHQSEYGETPIQMLQRWGITRGLMYKHCINSHTLFSMHVFGFIKCPLTSRHWTWGYATRWAGDSIMDSFGTGPCPWQRIHAVLARSVLRLTAWFLTVTLLHVRLIWVCFGYSPGGLIENCVCHNKHVK